MTWVSPQPPHAAGLLRGLGLVSQVVLRCLDVWTPDVVVKVSAVVVLD